MKAPDFWDDPDKANEIIQKVQGLKELTEPWQKIRSQLEDVEVLDELAREEDDEDTMEEAADKLDEIEEAISKFELRSMLHEREDPQNAFLSVQAGAGGTESCDWAQMLLRMYSRWAEHEGYKTELVESRAGEEAGIKSATLHVVGKWAFGYLKSERGVHRLVRISPFDSSNRFYTFFAVVDVVPDIEDDIEIDIDENEFEMDFMKSSGPGGQHVNKVASAVRLKHVPTGITVMCQSERSQHKNRRIAWNLIKAKLYQYEKRQREKELEKLYDEKGTIAWGNQIRSYVLQPYQMVKDTRTDFETSNVDRVLDGDLNEFMEAYLRHRLEEKSRS